MLENTLKNTNSKYNNGENKKISAKQLAVYAVFIALTYVFTAFVNIRLPFIPNGGLIHLGNIPLFIGALVFGWKTGMIAGGIGMALFDITTPWAVWAPFTLIIVGAMGAVSGLISQKKISLVRNIISIMAALLIKIIGYYFAEVILYGNWITPFTSIIGNICQVVIAAVIVLPIVPTIRKVVKNK